MTLEDMEDRLYCYRATCRTVVDGDTLDLDIDLGLRTSCRQRCRLLGLNAPEIHGVKKDTEEFQKGVDAASELVGLLQPEYLGHGLDKRIPQELYAGARAPLWVETVKDKVGKYGRFLVKVWVWQDSEILYLNQHLIDKGFAEKKLY